MLRLLYHLFNLQNSNFSRKICVINQNAYIRAINHSFTKIALPMPPSPVLPPAGSLLRSMLCLFLCCHAISSAQTSNSDGQIWQVPRRGGYAIVEPSPEATAMRQYSDVPVSYATGTADISIPLCQLSSGDLTVALRLELSYRWHKKE